MANTDDTSKKPPAPTTATNVSAETSQLEQAINYWRNLSPSVGDESRLCPEAAALATPYALMIITHRHDIPVAELN